MTHTNKTFSRDKTYQVVSVEKSDPPDGVEDGSWHRYVLALDNETLVGVRRGTLQQVTEYANEYAELISSRAGRGTSTWSTRKK